jgi:hypothetical protein
MAKTATNMLKLTVAGLPDVACAIMAPMRARTIRIHRN